MKPISTNPNRINNSRTTKSKGGCGKMFLAFLLLVVAIPSVIGLYLYSRYTSAVSDQLNEDNKSVSFTIETGDSVDTIIQNLIDAEILSESNSKYFQVYLKLNQLGSDIQAGTFEIPMNLNMKELAETLETAGTTEVWISLPEGLRADEYAEIIATEFVTSEDTSFDKQKFLSLVTDEAYIDSTGVLNTNSNLEGFIFPDKYLVPVDSTEIDIMNIILENFKSKITGEYTYEDIIIASLLEREGRGSDEKRMITDILHRRVNEGWFINIDATLLYYHKDWEHELTVDDLALDHPYNTYVYLGLPPTPICNPSQVSIEAALNPQPNDYYYYLHDEDGNIHYAKDYQEHLINTNTYLR